jgi:transcriptional regulator with XRE-family HTH domain
MWKSIYLKINPLGLCVKPKWDILCVSRMPGDLVLCKTVGIQFTVAHPEVNSMVNDGFGARLKELREQAGLTQQELADAAGMHRFGIAKLEQGLREPSWATVRNLCMALGISCEAFQVPAQEREPVGVGRPRKPADAPAKPGGEPAGDSATPAANKSRGKLSGQASTKAKGKKTKRN